MAGLVHRSGQHRTAPQHPGRPSRPDTDLDSYAFGGISAGSLCGRHDLDALTARYLAEMHARDFTDAIERFETLVRHMGIALSA